jgi:zinc-ribbon domain
VSESRFCARCGRELAADANFCSICGAPRVGATPSSSSVLPSNAQRFDILDVNPEQTGHSWIDFLMFRRMIIPILIRILFVVALVFCVIGFLVSLVQSNIGAALAILIVGPLVARIYCELIILLFVVNDTLADMQRTMAELRDIERSRAV